MVVSGTDDTGAEVQMSGTNGPNDGTQTNVSLGMPTAGGDTTTVPKSPEGLERPVRWQIRGRHRIDLVFYAAPSLTGKRSVVQIFPSGQIKGDVKTNEFRSMVIRAPHGTRFLLVTTPGDGWEAAPWRCIRMVDGFTVPHPKRHGLPGVRIPDLDLLHLPSEKKLQPFGTESSYQLVDDFQDGSEWTFGSTGTPGLKGRVRLIIIDSDDAPVLAGLSEGERVARLVLTAVKEHCPEHLDALAAAAIEGLEKAEQATKLRAWLDESS